MKRFALSILVVVFLVSTMSQATVRFTKAPSDIRSEAVNTLRNESLREAEWALAQRPVTVTAETSPLSAGGRHDFFSQADYFWPDSTKPTGPYINRDGMSNPDNFVAHRRAMIRFSKIIGALSTGFLLSGDKKYVTAAMPHISAWFQDTATLMNPNLQYSQAVIGQFTGRSWGVIDGIHLMEVSQGLRILEKSPAYDNKLKAASKNWFSEFITWLNTSKNGVTEKMAKNNHSTCWVAQVAAFAKYCGDEKMMDSCRNQYKKVLLPDQMAVDGSFPLEMARTKPYGYSLFNLDAMAEICQILSTPKDDLWKYQTRDGKSIRQGIRYLYPFVASKQSWTLKPDVMYWDEWPVAHPFLIFGANAYNENNWLETWKKLEHWPKVEEVIRNLPIRHPLIWL